MLFFYTQRHLIEQNLHVTLLYSAMLWQKALSAYYSSKQIVPFGFCRALLRNA